MILNLELDFTIEGMGQEKWAFQQHHVLYHNKRRCNNAWFKFYKING